MRAHCPRTLFFFSQLMSSFSGCKQRFIQTLWGVVSTIFGPCTIVWTGDAGLLNMYMIPGSFLSFFVI